MTTPVIQPQLSYDLRSALNKPEILQLRVETDEKRRWQEAAEREGVSVSTLLRKRLGMDETSNGIVIDPDGGQELRASDHDATLELRSKQLHSQGFTWPVARRMAREEMS